MVAGNMTIRLRLVLGALAATALLALTIAAVVSSPGEGVVASPETAAVATPAAVTAEASVTVRSSLQRPLRSPAPRLDVIHLATGGLCLLAAALTQRRRFRRDVGDSWRALLLGAPPGNDGLAISPVVNASA